jgi:hypothetical protein
MTGPASCGAFSFRGTCVRYATKSCRPSGTASLGDEKEACREARLLELLTIQPERIMIGATVFMMGILSGAGIAMWVMPPV